MRCLVLPALVLALAGAVPRATAHAAAVAAQLLAGQKLVLRDRATDRRKRAVSLTARGPAITLGRGPDSPDDPVVAGASLRIASFAGDAFDATYDLPAARWRYLGDAALARGYRFRGFGAVKSVVVRPGGVVRVVARGPGLQHSLGSDPTPVAAVLALGEQRYCVAFGGAVTYKAGRKLRAVAAPAPAACAANHTLWPMHAIDDRFRGSNALGRGDVDQDGFADYVTNYEFEQRYVIAFPPGSGGAVRAPWPTVVALQPPVPFMDGQQFDSESAALGDLDGDGNLDVVAAQGGHFTPFWEGYAPGIRLLFGPPPAQVTDPSAWTDGGRIPETIGEGHFLWVVPRDVNGDGALDVLAGGRILFDTMTRGGVLWIEAPASPAARRDPAQWHVHWIDHDQLSGHGFVLDDVDADGDVDLVDANADFDTPEDQETVHWYENPGTGAPAQLDPWPKHVIYQGPEFYVKPQIAVADLDGDGLTDVITAVESDVFWFRKTGLHPVTFERVVIAKPLPGRWLERPIRVADVNGDGRLDLFGMLTHNGGDIPGDRASAFWMEYTGSAPAADNWVLHPIKWGPGRVMAVPTFGEKWDQVDLTDVDSDGDLDVVANCEEWWQIPNQEFTLFFDPNAASTSAVAVVWFENRLAEAPFTFTEQGGTVAIEAEHHTTLRDGTWIKRARFGGYAGDGYLHVHNALATAGLDWSGTRGAEYAVNVQGGTYRVWLRRWAPAAWGYGLGGAKSNAVWLGIDGAAGTVADDQDAGFDAWTWVRLAAPVALEPGSHLLTLRARERGYAVDRIVLASDPAFTPSAIGPPETRY